MYVRPVWNAFSFGIRKLSALSYGPRQKLTLKSGEKKFSRLDTFLISAAFPLHAAFHSATAKALQVISRLLSLPK